MKQTILIIDDEADIRELLADIFADEGYNVLKAAHSEQAFTLIEGNKIDLIVLDIWLENSDKDGMEILRYLKKSDYKDIPVLMISGHGNIEMAVNAMKVGAFDFIEKPFKIDHILLTVERALDQKKLRDENLVLKKTSQTPSLDEDAYKSPAIISLLKKVRENAESDARTMIFGEVGVGKSKLASIIHKISSNTHCKIRYIHTNKINDETIEHDLLEPSILFVFEQIEKLSQALQTKLLTIISKNSHIKLIVTASPYLKEKVRIGSFSSALYDRLSVIQYHVPPLSERVEDIPAIIHYFIHDFIKELDVEEVKFSNEAMALLKSYSWTANVKELKLVIEGTILGLYLKQSEESRVQHLVVQAGDLLFIQKADNIVPLKEKSHNMSGGVTNDLYDLPLKEAREIFETQYLENILSKYDRNISAVSAAIGMDRTAIYRKLKSLGIKYDDHTKKDRA